MADRRPALGFPMRVDAQKLRLVVQLAFLALVLLIGWEFRAFVLAAQAGAPLPERPPGVEGFLPISSLMSLRLLVQAGELHPAHPAGVFILLGAAACSFAAAKAFCGWLCPFGLLSELLYKARRLLTTGAGYPPPWLDRPLSALKYLLLGFFLYAVAGMDLASLRAFLDGDYNLIADAKMYFFFARIGPAAAGVLAALLALSFAVPYFWCRYLCPYGALLTPFALAGPLKVRRSSAACSGCGLCAAACPQGIAVDKAVAVRSEKCVSCARCLTACPARGALEYRSAGGGLRLKPAQVGLLAALLFFAPAWLAMLAGAWRSRVAPAEYARLVPLHDALAHPGRP